jgi:two-component system LytT family response regulator
MKLRCIIVDDEPLAIEKLADYVHRMPLLTLETTFDNAIDAMEYLRAHPTDLMFLDIQMERLTGIQMLEIMKTRPCVVITSAYSQYAVRGYDLDVTDYLLKPISFERFVMAVEKAMMQILPDPPEEHEETQSEDHTGPADVIFVKADYHMQKVKLSEILFIEGMKDYLRIHLPTGRIMTLMSFVKLEKALPPDRFRRIHKSYIIPVDKIEQVERNHVMVGSHKIPIGNKYRKEFFGYLEKKQVI